MLYAALAQCPVIGGKVTSFDAAKAKTMPGVKHVVQITDGVAVVADTWWQAKAARDALTIQWDEGANGPLEHATASRARAQGAAAKPGAVIQKQGDVDDGMKGAAKTRGGRPTSCRSSSHSPMEPMNFTADVRKDSA